MAAADRPAWHIAEARWPADADLVSGLFREYVASLGVDISFQRVDQELATLPGRYARPDGVVLLARTSEAAAGVGAYRALGRGVAEMKRLFVVAEFRGQGVGRALAEALIEDARACGYRRMVFDTLESMGPARALYRALGFKPIAAYYENPLPGVAYLARDL